MNNKTNSFKLIKAIIVASIASVFFLAGCGPELLDDPSYLAQLSDSGYGDDLANKQYTGIATERAPMQADGCPAGGCPTSGCPTGGCEVSPDPDRTADVRLPGIVTSDPVIVTRTGERQDNVVTTNYHRRIDEYQPSVTRHTVWKNTRFQKNYFTTLVKHPTHRRTVGVVRTATAGAKVFPTQVVTEPMVDYGCAGAAVGAGRPYYRRGGLYMAHVAPTSDWSEAQEGCPATMETTAYIADLDPSGPVPCYQYVSGGLTRKCRPAWSQFYPQE